MIKRILHIFIIFVLFFVGFGFLAYPMISNYIDSLNHRFVISEYETITTNLDTGKYTEMKEAAIAYNQRLVEKSLNMVKMSPEEQALYNSLLNFSAAGIMGYVTIPCIDVELPIYHGTNSSILQQGVGHLQGSSLPIGGPSTHTVLAAHTGSPNAKLFTDLVDMKIGDIFNITVFNEKRSYQVDKIDIVLPNETSNLVIVPNEDLCTLVTCTPYGINTHRLLVRGHAIATYDVDISSGNESDFKGMEIDYNFNLLFIIIIMVLLGIYTMLKISMLRNRELKATAKANKLQKTNSANAPPPKLKK